jgi:ABC-type nitrate/sulfonate/bicarbonate transport system ATPase subunit
MGSTISIHGLTFSYDASPLFADFAIESSSRRILIRGPSGCGKTTLLKILAGVLVASPQADIVRPKEVFIVLQSDGLVPWLTGRENIELFSPSLWHEVASSSLFSLIEGFAERRACEMSFGQRRSVEIIRALVSKRPLLLLDEPLNFLDRNRRIALLAFMADRALCPSQILMTSHYEDGKAIPEAEVFEFEGDPPFRRLERST